MKKVLLLLLMPLLMSCGTSKSDEEEVIETSSDKYYVKYSCNYCSYHSHYIKYRNVDGELVSATIHRNTEEQFFEIGPVSPIFQAYIEGNRCIYSGCSINIYIKKNNQDYIRVAKQGVTSKYGNDMISLTYNMREYD